MAGENACHHSKGGTNEAIFKTVVFYLVDHDYAFSLRRRGRQPFIHTSGRSSVQSSGWNDTDGRGAMQGGTLCLTTAVTTPVGTAGISGSTDGTGTAARFNTPIGITTDGTNLYVADFNNHTIRKIVISSGVVTTLAGTAGSAGSTDGTGLAAMFSWPQGITTDGTNLYVADFNNHTIRQIVISSGVVTTLAGLAGSAGSTDGTGSAARLNNPIGITTDGTNLYVVDRSNHTIRRIQ